MCTNFRKLKLSIKMPTKLKVNISLPTKISAWQINDLSIKDFKSQEFIFCSEETVIN